MICDPYPKMAENAKSPLSIVSLPKHCTIIFVLAILYLMYGHRIITEKVKFIIFMKLQVLSPVYQ